MVTTAASTPTIVHALRMQALSDPMAPLLFHNGTTSRFGDLAIRAVSLASELLSAGLKPKSRVALLLENSNEYTVGYFGALWAGAVVVPLNPAVKTEGLLTYLNHSDSDWLIASSKHPELSAVRNKRDDSIRIIDISEYAMPVFDETTPQDINLRFSSLMEQPILASGSDWAAIMYTSGTAGKPKGVMLTHENLMANGLAITHYLQLNASDRTLCILPFYDAFGSSLLHTHVIAGGSLILVNASAYPALWAKAMSELKATGFSGVPTAYNLLLDRVNLKDFDLSSLRYLTQAGAAIRPVTLKRIRDVIPHADFFVMYGQTEATARLAYLPPHRLTEKFGSVGIPVSGVELEIRDDDGDRLPTGLLGEVWARGPNVMRGYWKDAALTETVLQDGWLRTGDLGFMDKDGFLFLHGRATDFIKTAA